MQTILINKGGIKNSIRIPTSKSYANRALILASLFDDSVIIKDLPLASDVTILVECLKQVGLTSRTQGPFFSIDNSFPACEKSTSVSLEVGEGGTTARFLAAMLLLGKQEYRLKLGARLKERPWDDFISFANTYGAKASLSGDLLIIQGPISLPGEVEIDCSKTTQFASAFQLLTIKTQTNVMPKNLNTSQSYWVMTEKIIEEISVTKTFEVPADWSSASYPLAFAALNQPVVFPGLCFDPVQADSKMFILLEQFKCLKALGDDLSVTPCEPLGNIILNVEDCLDLVPTLGYFFAHIPGTHRLKGVENLIHKESDRLAEVIKLLNIFGREAYTEGDELVIHGDEGRLDKKIDLTMPNDHRMVMVGTLFLLHHGGGSITPADAVLKSYPDFFKILENHTV